MTQAVHVLQLTLVGNESPIKVQGQRIRKSPYRWSCCDKEDSLAIQNILNINTQIRNMQLRICGRLGVGNMARIIMRCRSALPDEDDEPVDHEGGEREHPHQVREAHGGPEPGRDVLADVVPDHGATRRPVLCAHTHTNIHSHIHVHALR